MNIRIVLISLIITTLLLSGCATDTSSIPGWVKHETNNIEIWLPPNYEGGDLSEDLSAITDALRRLGSDYESMAQMIEQNPQMFELWAFDSNVGNSGFLTNMNVTKETIPSAITLDAYLDAATGGLPPEFVVTKREIISLNSYQAGRLIVEASLMGMDIKEVFYTIKDGSMIWNITCAISADEFDEHFPTFEQIAQSFAIKP